MKTSEGLRSLYASQESRQNQNSPATDIQAVVDVSVAREMLRGKWSRLEEGRDFENWWYVVFRRGCAADFRSDHVVLVECPEKAVVEGEEAQKLACFAQNFRRGI